VETFPTAPNLKEHCATQFFEGKFNFRLQPGQTATYTFDREGEYFYNDCTDPRPTGKVIVTLTSQDMPGALSFVPNVLNLRPADGMFTSVQGLITAMFKVPAGYTLDGNVQLKTPLTNQTFEPVTANVSGQTVIFTFDKSLVDNNMPPGDASPAHRVGQLHQCGCAEEADVHGDGASREVTFARERRASRGSVTET
jgi:plastocyanin